MTSARTFFLLSVLFTVGTDYSILIKKFKPYILKVVFKEFLIVCERKIEVPEDLHILMQARHQ